MFNQKTSLSSFSCMKGPVSEPLPKQPLVPVHLPSANDPLALTMQPCLINPSTGDKFSGQGNLKLNDQGGNHGTDKNFISSGKQPADDSSVKIEPQTDHDKKMKRLLANRLAAQRSRLRKLEYVENLKRTIENEEAILARIYPLVAYYEAQCKQLEIMNHELKEKMKVLESVRASKEAEYKALLQERYALGLAFKMLQEGKF